MKKSIVIMGIICLSLAIVCPGNIFGNEKNGIVMIDDNQAELSKDTFTLGMTKMEVIKMIKRKNMEIIRDDKHGTEGSSIYCKDMRFLFNPRNNVTEIFIYKNKTFRTVKGLVIGDNLKKIKALYGNGFQAHDEMDATVYQYKFKYNYFSIIVVNNIVSGWGIRK